MHLKFNPSDLDPLVLIPNGVNALKIGIIQPTRSFHSIIPIVKNQQSNDQARSHERKKKHSAKKE